MILALIYLLIGAALVHSRLTDIAIDVPNPGDIGSTTVTVLRWIVTWPAWVKR